MKVMIVPKYKVSVGYSGYIRGERTYEIEANSKEEAEQEAKYSFDYIEDNVIRDDTTIDDVDSEEI